MIKLVNCKLAAGILFLLVVGIACQVPPPGTPVPPVTEVTETPEPTESSAENAEDQDMDEASDEMAEMESTEVMEDSEAESADMEDSAVATGPISDEEAVELMYQLSDRDREVATAALERVLFADDDRFVSVFIELMRGAQVGLVQMPAEMSSAALETLTEERIGQNWGGWVGWYGNTELEPPPEFTTWKGEILSGIDPGFGQFLRSDFPTIIRPEEIQWGGVRVDGIPALDHSPMLSAAEADHMQPGDAVFGLSINGDNRAYPLKIIDWHEMANDTVGGVPVSLAYCTLCGAAVAYDGRGSDGKTYDFGSSGFLFRSNKLMYDRQTRTLWNQLTGEPVMGRLVGSDVQLELLPVVLTTWEDWLADHPDTQVLSVETGYERPYSAGAAYGDYFSSPGVMFPVFRRSDLLETKEQIYALNFDGQPKAYPIKILTEERVVNDEHAGQPVVLVAAGEAIEIEGVSRRAGSVTYSPGAEVRVYDRADYQFSPGEVEDQVVDEDGVVWIVTEEGLISEDGEMLDRLSGHLAYWFGWFAFFPGTEVYGVEG
ncbi:MAG: DUF3179 domain-containing (seleno)protein [Anaerolineae bacterium]